MKVIILSLLHDVIEDTKTPYEEVLEKFGCEIANGVLTLSKNDNLNGLNNMPDSLHRIKEQGKEVAIVKMSNRIFNLKDISTIRNKEKIISYKKESELILN